MHSFGDGAWRAAAVAAVGAGPLSCNALGALYQQRWNIELDLRNIKTTLGLKTLDCKTARMNEKQWWVGMLAYNLIRLLMLGSAKLADVLPRQISFNTPYSYGWHGVRADRPVLRT